LLASLLKVAGFSTRADVNGVHVVVGLSACCCRLHYASASISSVVRVAIVMVVLLFLSFLLLLMFRALWW
jgi:hypothetical protein